MKHAYLIIVHNEFEILEKLIACLDDERNDIFVHIDRKIKQLPELKTRYANLFVLQERVDVRWGHVSQIECEYKLFEVAYKSGTYSRFHLLSGTHLPLKTQDEIHAYFNQYSDVEYLQEMGTDTPHTTFKMGRYHFFLRWYRHSSPLVARVSQIAWFKTVKLQEKLGIGRNTDRFKRKASNWVNLTPKAIEYILGRKAYILQRFRYTFCGDEYFVPHLLDNADEPFNINYSSTCCYYDFGDQSNPRILTIPDYEHLTAGEYLFAKPHHPLVTAMSDLLLYYWQTQERLIDYFCLQILFHDLVEGNMSEHNCPIINDCLPHYLHAKVCGGGHNDWAPQLHINQMIKKMRQVAASGISYHEIAQMCSFHKLTYFQPCTIDTLKKELKEYL